MTASGSGLQLLIDLQQQQASGVAIAVLESRYGIPVQGETADPLLAGGGGAAPHLWRHGPDGPAPVG